MSNGTGDGERRDDSFVERLGDRISATPGPLRPAAPRGAPAGSPVLGPGDFDEAPTMMSSDSEPPPPETGTLPPLGDGSGVYDAPIDQPPPSRPDDAFAEFEASAMPGESTRIEESDLIADQSTAMLDEGPKMPFLFVEAGKDKGKEYVLQEGETGVGRGIDNDVILTDVSVSRKHLRVLRDGAGLVLRDLGSGNGTTVNGKRVHQIALNEGDRIELGETVLVVKLPIDRPLAPVMASSGSTSESALPHDAGGPPAMIPAWTAPMPPISGSAETLAPRDGNTATVRLPRRTLVAAVAAVAALALMLGVGVGAVVLVAGRSGSERVQSLPITSVPVMPSATGVPTIRSPNVAVPPTIVPSAFPPIALAPPATGLPATGLPATGLPSTPAPPTSVATAALGPAAPIASTSATPPPVTAAPPPEPEPEPVADTTPRGRSPRSARPTREPASTSTASAQARISAAYNSGDFDGAAAIARDAARHTTGADQRSLESLANNIDSFAGLYPRIHSAGDALGPVAGIVPIALRLDRQIVSGGHYARDIQPRFVRYLVTQARAQIGSAPQTACPRVRDALDLDGGNADAQALARQCETAATRMLADAQSHERTDAAGAQRSYATIQTMVPRTSATYRTAAERATALRRATPITTGPRRVDEDE